MTRSLIIRRLLIACMFVLVAQPVLGQVEVVRRHFGPDVGRPIPPAQIVERLRAVAGDLNGAAQPPVYGVLKKTTGTHCIGYACDIICHADGRHWDVLVDAENAATPAWHLVGTIDPARCTIADSSGPTPPRPVPPVDPLKPVLAALAELLAINQAALTHLHDDLERMEAKEDQLDARLAALEANTASLSNQLVELQARPFPAYQGRVIGWPVTLRPQNPRP